MASVKKLKSKGRAVTTATVLDDEGFVEVPVNTDYVLRKRQFADLPPAKIVKPVRVLNRRAAKAVRTWAYLLGVYEASLNRLGANATMQRPVFPDSVVRLARDAQRNSGTNSLYAQYAAAA